MVMVWVWVIVVVVFVCVSLFLWWLFLVWVWIVCRCLFVLVWVMVIWLFVCVFFFWVVVCIRFNLFCLLICFWCNFCSLMFLRVFVNIFGKFILCIIIFFIIRLGWGSFSKRCFLILFIKSFWCVLNIELICGKVLVICWVIFMLCVCNSLFSMVFGWVGLVLVFLVC